MQTIHATEAAEAAININRVDWIHGAAELVLNNQVQYDRSTSHNKEAFICRQSIIDDMCETEEYTNIINKWVDGGECCDYRDDLRILILNDAMADLSRMADDFNIGVE